MLRRFGRASRFRAAALLGAALFVAPGCALIPSWDDVSSASALVKDTVTGKAKRDRQTQAFAEARIMERRQDYAGAEKLYRELLTERPDSRDCYHRLAVMAALQSKFAEAGELYQRALACGSPTSDLWNDVGYCHYLQHQMPEAEGAFRQALALTPQHRSAMNNLAMVLGEQGNFEEAYRLFQQGNPAAEAEANFAFLCAQYGDFPRAQQHYSRALSINPELKNAVDGLFEVTERMQQLQQMQAGQSAAPADGVQPVSYDAPPPTRPLIEVYTAGSKRPATPNAAPIPTEAANGTGAVQQAGGEQAPAATAAPPSSAAGGALSQPYSFAQQPQPQYLQPTSGPRTAQSAPAPTNPGLLNAGGPFPPLVGGASATR